MNDLGTTFHVNDVVVHCREGLSTIVGTSAMGGREYFVVKTNGNGGETICVPVDANTNIIRHILNENEADELLLFMKKMEKNFNPNTKQRRDAFKRSLASGDIKEIAYLSRYLYFYKQLGEDNDEIRLGAVDLEMLNYAHSMLMDELALTFRVVREKIEEFVYSRIQAIK